MASLLNFTFHSVGGGGGGGGGHAGGPGEGSDSGPKPGGDELLDDDAVGNFPKMASSKYLKGLISFSNMVNFTS